MIIGITVQFLKVIWIVSIQSILEHLPIVTCVTCCTRASHASSRSCPDTSILLLNEKYRVIVFKLQVALAAHEIILVFVQHSVFSAPCKLPQKRYTWYLYPVVVPKSRPCHTSKQIPSRFFFNWSPSFFFSFLFFSFYYLFFWKTSQSPLFHIPSIFRPLRHCFPLFCFALRLLRFAMCLVGFMVFQLSMAFSHLGKTSSVT